MQKFWSVLAGLISILGGCQRPTEDGSGQGNRLAVAVPTEDAAIEDATKEARNSLNQFISQLSHPKPSQSDFSIKVPIREGGIMHYLWVQEVTYNGANFSG